MIIGENPWLLSQVHYIIPVCICNPPPSQLSSDSPPAGDLKKIFFKSPPLSPAETRNVNRTRGVAKVRVRRKGKSRARVAPEPGVRRITLSPPEVRGPCRSPQPRRHQRAYSPFPAPLLGRGSMATALSAILQCRVSARRPGSVGEGAAARRR